MHHLVMFAMHYWRCVCLWMCVQSLCVCVCMSWMSVLLDTWYYRPSLPGEIPLRLLWTLFLEKRDILAFPLTLTVFTPSFQVWPVAALAKEQFSSVTMRPIRSVYFRGSDHVSVSCATETRSPLITPWASERDQVGNREIKIDYWWFPKSVMPVTVVNWLWWWWWSRRQVNV